MADGKELKPRSFRIDDETLNKLKEISNSIGGSQQDTMNVLINAYEMESQQRNLSEFQGNIKQFQSYVTSLVALYMESLQSAHDMRETVRTEFDALLRSKDSTIQDLQARLSTAKQLKEEATAQAKTYGEENGRLNELLEKSQKEHETTLIALQSRLEDKEDLNRALNDSNNDLKAKIDALTKENEEIGAIRKNLTDKATECEVLKNDKVELEKSLESAKTTLEVTAKRMQEEAQLTQEKAILEIEKKYQDQIQQLKEEKQKEIDTYQKKYFDLLEQIKK